MAHTAAVMFSNPAPNMPLGHSVATTINVLIGKRFAKKPANAMVKKQGAHHSLQTRASTLDATLHSIFKRWYPGMATDDKNLPHYGMRSSGLRSDAKVGVHSVPG